MTATIATTAAPIGLYEHLEGRPRLPHARQGRRDPARPARSGPNRAAHPRPVPGRAAGRGSGGHQQPQAGARLRFARFPSRRTLAEFDFDFQPRSTESWSTTSLLAVRQPGDSAAAAGPTRVRQDPPRVALATAAVEAGYRGYFSSAADLCATIWGAYADGTFAAKIRTYTGPSVLVVETSGSPHWTGPAGNAFFQVINRRYDNGSSTIVTTNRGLPGWGELFGEPSSPQPSWTGCSTGPWCSTSGARAGGCASTRPYSPGSGRGWAPRPDHMGATGSEPRTSLIRNLDPRTGRSCTTGRPWQPGEYRPLGDRARWGVRDRLQALSRSPPARWVWAAVAWPLSARPHAACCGLRGGPGRPGLGRS